MKSEKSKMLQQLHKEHLKLQKAFGNLYGCLVDRNNNGINSLDLVEEKSKLEKVLAFFQTKVAQLQRELHLSKERCELLEFCFLELEHKSNTYNTEDAVDCGVNTDCCWLPSKSPSDSECTELSKTSCAAQCSEKKCDIYTCQYCPRIKTMDQDQCRKKLDESREKLSVICKQLDIVCGSGSDSKDWGCMHEIVSSVEELQSLIAWIIDKKGTKEESSVISQKLQKLNEIREVLEKSACDSQKHLWPLIKQDQHTVSEQEAKKPYKYCQDSESLPRRKVNFYLPRDSVSGTTAKNDEAFDFTDCSSEDTLYGQSEEVEKGFDLIVDKDTKVYLNESFKPFHSLTKPRMNRCSEDQPDSMSTAISEDEGLGEESRRGDSTGPNSLMEISDSISDLPFDFTLPPEVFSDESSDGNQAQNTWVIDSSNHRNSLELCLVTIAKLKKTLSGKENELLELKTRRMAEEEIPKLKTVVDILQNDMEKLQSKVNVLEKENESLKEQVLELEEAENDARFKGQHLQEKLVFLQEKDSHFQAELSEAKQSLELCIDELSLKDNEERELKSQLKYMEVLIQKYEDQIRKLETSQLDLKEKLKLEEEKQKEMAIALEKEKKLNTTNLATLNDQKKDTPICGLSEKNETSYDFCPENTCFVPCAKENSSTLLSQNPYEFHMIAIPPAFRSTFCDAAVQTSALHLDSATIDNIQLLYHGCEETHSANEGSSDDLSPISVLNCPIQKELLKRLHHLAEEDADLQQQLHHVDQINLTLWQKLHDLQFHIGECQKENFSEGYHSCVDDSSSETTAVATSPTTMDRNEDSNSNDALSNFSGIFNSEFKDEKLKDRLTHLENINVAFLKQLNIREQLCIENNKKHTEWIEIECRLTKELQSLKMDKDSMLKQITELETKKLKLTNEVDLLESKLSEAKEKNQREVTKVTNERDSVMKDQQRNIDTLLSREKGHMKQIMKLQCEKRKGGEKMEFETLKTSYVQLQLELEKCRDEMETVRQSFEKQLECLKEKHSVDENRLLQALASLRQKDTECNNKLAAIQSNQKAMEDDLAKKQKELDDSRNQFIVDMQAAEEKHKLVEDELRRKLFQMEEGTAVATKALTEERLRLEKELQGNIDDLRLKEATYKTRIRELESNVSQLHTELHRLTGNLRLKWENEEDSKSITSFQRERMFKELQELRFREGELREKLDEMEKKEAAYRETLEHADRIVASVERGYKNKIEELELSERSLKQKVGYLEEVESGLRTALQRERRSSDGRKPEDLILELNEAEKRENALKDDLAKFEQYQRNSAQKIKDLEKIRENLESQLSDREDLAFSFEKIRKEQEVTKKELLKVKKSENSLQLALEHTQNLLKTRESDIEAEIQRFIDEKKGLEETINQLRSQVREFEQQFEKHRGEEDLEGEVPISNYSTHEKSGLPESFHSPFTRLCNADYSEVTSGEKGFKDKKLAMDLETNSTNELKSPLDANSSFLHITNDKEDHVIKNCEESISLPAETAIDHDAICDKIPVETNMSCKRNEGSLTCPDVTVRESLVLGCKQNSEESKSTFKHIPEFIPEESTTTTPLETASSSTKPSSDLETHGIDNEYHRVRLHLEQCMLRAMDVMKMEMEKKASSKSPEEYLSEASEDVMKAPLNFHVVQQVGSDTVLVGWEYSPTSTLVGFEVYVNGQLHETVLTPDRRKAVIGNLNLSQPLSLSIYAVSSTGQVSEPQVIHLASNVKTSDGFFFQDEDDSDDFFDDVSSREIRPFSMDW